MSNEIDATLRSMGEVGAKIRMIWPQLRDILDQLKMPDAQLVRLRKEAMKLLSSVGMLKRKQRVQCCYAGVHACNRYGDGIVPANVHTLIKGIFAMFFDKNELDHPTAVEMPPNGNPRRVKLIKFNLAQTEGSAGRLPLYENNCEDIKKLK